MDVNNPSIEELEKVYTKYFSLKNLGPDITNKIGLICLICWVYDKLKAKNPDLTYWQVVWKFGKDSNASKDFLKGLAVVCRDFGYACSKFPLFGVAEKDVPKQIKEFLKEYLPF